MERIGTPDVVIGALFVFAVAITVALAIKQLVGGQHEDGNH